MNSKNYFFIGCSGVGKSYWAKRIASHIKANYLDLDQEIVNHSKKSIAHIFEEEGEISFRKIENCMLNKLVKNQNNMILACGGGTACYHNNISILRQYGRVIHLKRDWKIAYQQIKEDPTRPLTKVITEKEFIDLCLSRKVFYDLAHQNIDINNITLEEFLTKLK